uniref:Uncharacterized protein n=1 Tax=Moniliophthora roreri TaxID=221103 RepID=A0A0W0G537_MONRR
MTEGVLVLFSCFDIVLPLYLVIMVDLMLLHCCYVIWGSSKWIAFPMIFVMVSLAICEIVASAFGTIGISNYTNPANQRLYTQGSIIDKAFWLANMGVNIILTLLTAGHIWWISHEAQKHMGPAIRTNYHTIVAIIWVLQLEPIITQFLESGILYSIFVIIATIYTTLTDPDHDGSFPFSLWLIVYQIAGIAPTLIIIRAAKRRTVEYTSMNQALSSLHFANSASPESGNLNARSHVWTVDIKASSSAERISNLREEKTT